MKKILYLLVTLLFTGCTINNNVENTIEVIDDSSKETSVLSVQNIITAANYYYNSLYTSNLGVFEKTTFICNGIKCSNNYTTLDIANNIPTSGNITILEDGKVIIEDLVINNYVCNIINDKITCEN